jgi:uncharacterized protein
VPATVTETTIEGAPALDAYLVRSDRPNRQAPGVVLCHGFPSMQRPGVPNRSYQLFAERIAAEQGWTVLAISLRGCGDSAGSFSMNGWLADVGRGVERLRAEGCRGVWLVGSTTGGSLSILAAAQDPDIQGVAVMAPRADFDDWASEPRRFMQHCRTVGVVAENEPASLSTWTRQLREHRAIDAVPRLAHRPLLILHGLNDRQVPAEDARSLAARHPSAELRLIAGADHRIRHDPRAVAVLLGWLGRQAVDQSSLHGSAPAIS